MPETAQPEIRYDDIVAEYQAQIVSLTHQVVILSAMNKKLQSPTQEPTPDHPES